MGSSSQLPRPPTTSHPSNRKFRINLALGNRADRYISPMRIQNFRARWGFLYPALYPPRGEGEGGEAYLNPYTHKNKIFSLSFSLHAWRDLSEKRALSARAAFFLWMVGV